MKYILRIVIVFCFIVSTVFAEKLEIKLNGKSIELPYWSALKKQHGVVILIHGTQKAHWSLLLASLAKRLSKQGWSTVLLNCNQDNPEPWVKELPEVVNVLRQQKNNRVVVLHYGEQLKQTFDVYNKSNNAGIEGLILLSAYNLPKSNDQKPELSMPILDIVGQFDYDLVQQQKSARERDFAKNKYLAKEIPGANHDYQYSKQLLLAFISGWMLKRSELKPPPVLVSYIVPIEPLMPKELAFDDESDQTVYTGEPIEETTQEILPH